MKTKVVTIPADQITDKESFHDVFQKVLGFPGYYGRNMDAWIDCMTCLDDPDSGMTEVAVGEDEILTLKIDAAAEFAKRCPNLFKDLIECTAFVNYRRTEIGDSPLLSLMLNGEFTID